MICAISTAPGVGGIAVIRVSGEGCFEVCDKLFKAKKKGHTIVAQKAYTMSFGELINPDTQETVDEVVVAVFRTPHSFTGEDTVEISCHGSQFIQQEILRLLVSHGSRMAGPGEFTQRAFLNGRMDLTQAEAVADLIASKSAASNRLALSQMRGGFSSELAQLRAKLLHFVSLVELELDFSEEDVEFADRTQLSALTQQIHTVISRLLNSFSLGNAIKNGIPVALVGETNVGKSTLLNQLLHEERAIVSDIHGTTRDTIEDTITINGLQFRFIDTAGIRDTDDTIESLGIQRSFDKIEQAQIVLWLVDSSNTGNLKERAQQILKHAEGKDTLVLLNKIDKVETATLEDIRHQLSDYPVRILEIAAKQGQHIQELEQQLVKCAQIPEISEQDIVVTNLRHYEALQNAERSIEMVENGLQTQISSDFLSQDIRECQHYLGEITGGEISSDEVLGNIFAHFCIGK